MKNSVRTRLSRRLFAERIDQLEARELLAANVISGYVFNDVNHDGLFQNTESPLGGSTIELINSHGVVIGTTTAATNGSYSFSTDRSVSTTPTTLSDTASFPSSSTPVVADLNLPQFNPALGTLTSVDVVNSITVDNQVFAANTSDSIATVTGTFNGTGTATGPGVPGLVVNTTDSFNFNVPANGNFSSTFPGTPELNTQSITSASALSSYIGTGTVSLNDTVAATAHGTGNGNGSTLYLTSANGSITLVYHYVPSNMIQPGNYTIVQTTQPPGFTNGLNSSNGTVLTATPGNNTIPVTVTPGTTLYPNNDFGQNEIVSMLSGSVWLDTNNNGIRDQNEFGIDHVTVDLVGTTASGLVVSEVTTTNATGNYTFSNLAAGTYTISEVQPKEFIKGKNHLGSLGGVVSKFAFSSISVPPGANGVSYDFGQRVRPGCKLINLTQDEHRLNPSQVGPLIQYYLPSLVPVLLKPGLVKR